MPPPPPISSPAHAAEPPPVPADKRGEKADTKAGCDLFAALGGELVSLDGGDSKCEWLRSQIVGAEAEFDSPFGRRRITYSDHTASGRSLRFVEEFIQRNVLPFYGEHLFPCSSLSFSPLRPDSGVKKKINIYNQYNFSSMFTFCWG